MTEAEKELIEVVLGHRPDLDREPYEVVIVSKGLAEAVKRVRAERAPKPRWTTRKWESGYTMWIVCDNGHEFVRCDRLEKARILVDALNAREEK